MASEKSSTRYAGFPPSGERIAVVGRESRLTRALAPLFNGADSVEFVSLRQLASLSRSSLDEALKDFIQEVDIVIWCGAVLDYHHEARDTIMYLNCTLPTSAARLILGGGQNVRFVTLGSALENLPVRNSYLESKRALRLQAESHEFRSLDWTHIRTHTLVDREIPRSSAFLGNLLTALQLGGKFEIHGTHQSRVFLDMNCIAKSILQLVKVRNLGPKSLVVGGKKSVNLYELAKTAIDRFAPSVSIYEDASKAWTVTHAGPDLVRNDIETDCALDIDELLRRLKDWVHP